MASGADTSGGTKKFWGFIFNAICGKRRQPGRGGTRQYPAGAAFQNVEASVVCTQAKSAKNADERRIAE